MYSTVLNEKEPNNSVVSSPFSQEHSLLFLSALDGTTEKGTTSRFALLNRWDGMLARTSEFLP
jgi:hypothetical protein